MNQEEIQSSFKEIRYLASRVRISIIDQYILPRIAAIWDGLPAQYPCSDRRQALYGSKQLKRVVLDVYWDGTAVFDFQTRINSDDSFPEPCLQPNKNNQLNIGIENQAYELVEKIKSYFEPSSV